jgi:hypothetical protein
VLDLGTVQSTEGWAYTGFIAALKPDGQNVLELVLDYGTMIFQDGRQFVGEFSITHKETEKFEYY